MDLFLENYFTKIGNTVENTVYTKMFPFVCNDLQYNGSFRIKKTMCKKQIIASYVCNDEIVSITVDNFHIIDFELIKELLRLYKKKYSSCFKCGILGELIHFKSLSIHICKKCIDENLVLLMKGVDITITKYKEKICFICSDRVFCNNTVYKSQCCHSPIHIKCLLSLFKHTETVYDENDCCMIKCPMCKSKKFLYRSFVNYSKCECIKCDEMDSNFVDKENQMTHFDSTLHRNIPTVNLPINVVNTNSIRGPISGHNFDTIQNSITFNRILHDYESQSESSSYSEQSLYSHIVQPIPPQTHDMDDEGSRINSADNVIENQHLINNTFFSGNEFEHEELGDENECSF